MSTYYVKSIKFTTAPEVYQIRDAESKERLDNLARVSTTGSYKDLTDTPMSLPPLPFPSANTDDLILKWNHTSQVLEWVKISSEPEYDPTTQSLSVSNEVYDSSSNTLETPSVEPSED